VLASLQAVVRRVSIDADANALTARRLADENRSLTPTIRHHPHDHRSATSAYV